MTAAYPSTLPRPMSFGMKPDLQLAFSADGEMGAMDYRRRSRQPSASASIAFKFLQDQYKVFLAWWTVDLAYGHKWFTINLPSAQGYVQHYVRFKSKIQASKRGYRWIELEAEIEIRERQVDAPFEPFVPEVYDFDMPVNTYNQAGSFVYSGKYILNVPSSSQNFLLTTPPSRTFASWSGFPSDSVSLPWNWLIYVRGDSTGLGTSFTDWIYGGVSNSPFSAATPEGARLLAPPNALITGYTQYYFWFFDPNPGDNRGGMSFSVIEQESI